jgi:PglZ domain
VAPRAKRGSVAYLMVDALRFELGHDLVDALRRQFEDPQVEVEPAVALLPSITRVGMANLCPGAGENLQFDLTDGDRLVVRIGAFEVTGVEDRLSLLRAAHGKVADLRLDDVFRLGERELGEQVGRANLVLVRSQEIDDSGESGKISAHLQSFDATVQQLSRAVARLAQQGVSQFVITADHGFLALTRDLGPQAIIPKPGGRGEVHRRAFVGRGGRVGDALVRVPLSKIGLPGDLDVLVPRGLALIAAGGARGFFHGGASPQELIVPVITVEVQPPTAASLFVVDASLTAKITSQVFTGKLLMPESLLSAPLTVRPVPVRRSDDREVGVLVTAGGAEQGERLVQLQPGAEVSLGFRATTSLGKGDRIELQVFDAQTDRRLASSRPSTVARALEVDDELL